MRAIGGLLFPMLAGACLAQQSPPLFTTSSNNVLVDAAVTSDGSQVAKLRQEDFIVLDNGRPAAIAGFAHDELPLDIVLVCQAPLRSLTGWNNVGRAQPFPGTEGGPMVYQTYRVSPDSFAAQLEQGVTSVVSAVLPGDQLAIVGYGRDPRIDLRFTDDRKTMTAAVRRLIDRDHADDNIVTSSEGLAIEYAVRMISDVEQHTPNARDDRRRLIILISNIFGVGVPYPDDPLIRKLWQQNIVLSVINDAPPTRSMTTVQRSPGGDSQATLFRRYGPIHIAQATGGGRILALDAHKSGDLLTPTRQRYTLWISQPSDAKPGESRSIKVDLSEETRRRLPNAVVRAREGYVAR